MNDKPSELDAFLPLPNDPQKPDPADDDSDDDQDEVDNPAADLIRQKVEAAYADEPDAATEALDINAAAPAAVQSKHQQFIYDLTGSGKSLAEIQMAWHDYYAGLTDIEKHQVWQEFYSSQAAESNFPAAANILAPAETKPPAAVKAAPATEDYPKPIETITRTLVDLKEQILRSVPKRKGPKKPMNSLLFGVSVGAIVVLVFLFSFFNERFIAPFIQPSRSLSNVPLITDNSAVGPNPEVIIPKINVEIPVVYDVNTINEAAIDGALENGVVHYADTAMPGQDGNVVIVGHSSNNIFNKGKYKFAFVLLSRLEPGDTFYLQKDGKRYTYQVYQKKVVKPNDVSVLGTTEKPATATLITCDPPGTSVNRLVVTGEQINPDPGANSAKSSDNQLATQSKTIPGNAQSLWARFVKWLSH
ncbi:MAG TPA: class D sortase [Candidatus Saccharimonadales bacterium]|nr:class D sortase [Candidatus Saccharimonadales bacterium]